MPKKIDPLNKKQYCSVTPMLTVSDVKASADFYQKAFGFSKRRNHERPGRQSRTAELTLRGMTIILGQKCRRWVRLARNQWALFAAQLSVNPTPTPSSS